MQRDIDQAKKWCTLQPPPIVIRPLYELNTDVDYDSDETITAFLRYFHDGYNAKYVLSNTHAYFQCTQSLFYTATVQDQNSSSLAKLLT